MGNGLGQSFTVDADQNVHYAPVIPCASAEAQAVDFTGVCGTYGDDELTP